MTVLGVIIAAIEGSGLDAALPESVYALQAGAFLILALCFGVWALPPNPALVPALPRTDRQPTAPGGLVARLDSAMQDGLWRREGLTIGQLAAHLNTPEHKLRSTINGDLGHRNFSTFINDHRIEAAKAILDAPDQDGVSILEIAYDVGFASLGPFNRAFKDRTGQSPSGYRAARSDRF